MAQRATSLGPKPSLCYLFVFCFFLFLFLSFFELPPFSRSLSLSLSCYFSCFLSVFQFCIWFLFFPFVFASLFQDVLLVFFVFFFCFLSCFVLNHHVGFLFALHLVFWLLLFFVPLALLFCRCFFDFWKPVKNFSEKVEIPKIAKMKNPEKTDILTRAISTVVFTNSVFFSFFVFL